MTVSIAMISDTHLAHRDLDIEIPEADILIHAGDMTKIGQLHEVVEFNAWFSALPHKHKVVIAGNHDFAFQRYPVQTRILLSSGVHYLEDSEVTIEGLRIYGSPWQPWFCNWAFNLQRGADIRVKWDLIPNGIDVLVTHGPPKGIGDLTSGGEYVGCDDLMEAVIRVSPKLHVFGHIHEGSGEYRKGNTTFVNASVLDERYQVVHSGRWLSL